MLNLTKVCILLLLWTCLAAACVSPTGQPKDADKVNPPVKVNPTKIDDATEFLHFAESFSNLPVEMQKKVLIETNQALVINPNDLLQRMNLVMIYGVPTSTLLDTAKAQNLLQQILQEDILANSKLAFANLLFDHLVATNKAAKSNNGDPKRLENLQQKNEALQMKLDAMQQKLDATQQKLDASLQKLDELRKIEKSMGERDATPQKIDSVAPKK